MNDELKPLPEFISGKMIDAIRDGKSIFQKPMKTDRTSQFVQPFNGNTGKKYTGATALILMMQDRADPRWMSYEQASYNKTPVKKNAKSTYFNFLSSTVSRPVMKDGEPVMKENNKPQMERVTLNEPVLVDAFVFNGKELKGLPEWKPVQPLFSPTERAERMLEAVKASFGNDDSLMQHSPHTDTFLKEMDEFPSPELYYATALHEAAHWLSHDGQINKQVNDPSGNLIKEELRTNIASLFISAELNLPYDPSVHEERLYAFVQLIKDDPGQLFSAADDAQNIADAMLNLEREYKYDRQAAPVKSNPDKLEKGDVINYGGHQYTVLDKLKNNVFEMQKGDEKFKMNTKNGIYQSLLEAKKNPRAPGEVASETREQEREPAMAEEESSTHKMKR